MRFRGLRIAAVLSFPRHFVANISPAVQRHVLSSSTRFYFGTRNARYSGLAARMRLDSSSSDISVCTGGYHLISCRSGARPKAVITDKKPLRFNPLRLRLFYPPGHFGQSRKQSIALSAFFARCRHCRIWRQLPVRLVLIGRHYLSLAHSSHAILSKLGSSHLAASAFSRSSAPSAPVQRIDIPHIIDGVRRESSQNQTPSLGGMLFLVCTEQNVPNLFYSAVSSVQLSFVKVASAWKPVNVSRFQLVNRVGVFSAFPHFCPIFLKI